MENRNSKHIRERQQRIRAHRERKLAEFEELARGWIPEEYRSDSIVADAPLSHHVYFMMLDYLMSTGNVDEVKRFFEYVTDGLEKVKTRFGEGGAAANN
jgi:hypothetical protein